jgi:hypothetical protein
MELLFRDEDSMKYFLGLWNHSFADEPAWMLYEYDSLGDVKRMIEYFKIGKFELRSAEKEGVESLHESSFSISEIDKKSKELIGFDISKQDFDAAWKIFQ